MRLLVTVLVTLAAIGATGYVLLDRALARRQVVDYAAAQRADAKGFEVIGRHGRNAADAIRRISPFLDVVKQRPGALIVTLVGPGGFVSTSSDVALIGSRDTDPRLAATFAHGTSYARRSTEPGERKNDFEFIVPVNLPGGRFAYKVSYDHVAYDAQLDDVRTVVLIIALLTLVGGGGVFYLVGGRRLIRDHRRVLRRASRDGLTDLSNQRAFQDEFPEALAAASRHANQLALVVLDIDDFKVMNDRRGHPFGDAALIAVAAALREGRPGDRAYRIGGDEFALVLPHTSAAGASVLTRRLCRKLASSGIEISVGVSGMRPGIQADTLRAEADAALYQAKRHGGNDSAQYDEIAPYVIVNTAEKNEATRRLIEERRLTTEFQPIWDIGAETLLGVEALARPDPSYGLSGPAEAFDIAEQLGLVRELDVLCVESALRSVSHLEPGVLLFINLSPLTLELDVGAENWLTPAVERAGLTPEMVVIEVTERFGGHIDGVVRRLNQLRAHGFKVAVDDVGTGNSGLEILRKVEAEFVKIDRSIITAAPLEPGARAVLMAMATFARQTGSFVIAEGIEDEATLRYLQGIDQARVERALVIQGGQGYGLGRPSSRPGATLPAIFRSLRV